MSYLSKIYDQKERPITSYPDQLAKHLCDKFNIKSNSKIIDIGCGRGDILKAFGGLVSTVKGIDIEPIDDSILPCNVSKDIFPFPDNYFDVVFSKSVIEHIYNPEHFMREQMRILKPGGRIIILTPDWYTQMKIFYDDHTHCRPYTKRGLRDLLRIMNFNEIKTELFYQLPILWKYPFLKTLSKTLQLAGPVNKLHKNKFIRWSRELMILGTGIK